MIPGTTYKPNILINTEKNYVVVGSIDHGMEIPGNSISDLIFSLDGATALMMEVPEELHHHFHPMSTEILTKVSVGNVPIEYLYGNRGDEDIGNYVLKYAPEDISEVFIPALHVRNCIQLGTNPTFDSLVAFIAANKNRYGFIDIKRTLDNYMKIVQYWEDNGLDPKGLDHFSYDFEKFVGDIREFELWKPELQNFRGTHEGKIAVCVGDYHVDFVDGVLDGREQKQPEWNTHIDNRREDRITPQDPEFLKNIYNHIEKALES